MKAIFATLALIACTAHADSSDLIPLSSQLFDPTNLAVDTDGNVHVDSSLWQTGPSGVYTGRGNSLQNYRVAVDSQGVITEVAANGLTSPDAGWKELAWTTLKQVAGTSNAHISQSPYASIVTLGKDHKVASQTQCVQGSCLTVTPKACQKLAALSHSKNYDDLYAKIQQCNDLRTAWEKTFQDPDVSKEMSAAFARDTARLTKSPINNSFDKPMFGSTSGLTPVVISDLSYARTFTGLYAETCRSQFSGKATSAADSSADAKPEVAK